jgi:hypothetical protein
VVADAARARVLALDIERSVAGPMTSDLVELTCVTNPMLRAIDSAAVSDSGSGRRGGARTPLHSTPDHRDHRRRDSSATSPRSSLKKRRRSGGSTHHASSCSSRHL